jgi:hypothetical protein
VCRGELKALTGVSQFLFNVLVCREVKKFRKHCLTCLHFFKLKISFLRVLVIRLFIRVIETDPFEKL